MYDTGPELCQGTCSTRGDSCYKGRRRRIALKCAAVILCWGILSGSLLMNQSILVKANGLSYQVSYDDGIPEEIRSYCELVGTEYDICPEILEAMAYRESRFIPEVVNGPHYGLMQINVYVHKARIEKYGWTAEDMLDPYKNLMVAGDYLHELYEIYGDENPIVLAIYSGNWKAVNTYKEYGFMLSNQKTKMAAQNRINQYIH